jgi:hemolysin activation/secretion protein
MLSRFSVTAVALTLAAGASHAQTPPDAGRLLQEIPIPKPTLPERVDVEIDRALPEPAKDAQGGPQVQLESIRFEGAEHVGNEALQAAIAPALGKRYDMAGLQRLAAFVTRFYRDQGFPFARAYLPEQKVTNGVLRVAVIEGRYGKVTARAEGDAKLASDAQPYLSSLQPGDVISTAALERAVLILSDQPGIDVRPVIRPGEAVGTGDLDAEVIRTRPWDLAATYDNFGNRYSGRHRATVQGALYSPFRFGDQLNAALMATDQDMYFGSLSYATPLGSSGLRGDIGYAYTDYALGEEFADLRARGRASIVSTGVSYPIIRSNRFTLLGAAHYQYKDLRDSYEALDYNSKKSVQSVVVGLRFDARDGFAGGGITYGELNWVSGSLDIKSPLDRQVDDLTARTQGGFNKFTFDITRLQALPAGFSLYARGSMQFADKNLDSSESISLGGANGVRAYPQGEAVGDEGALAQVELRYRAGDFTPYAFWDIGTVRINQSPWQDVRNRRTLSGAGLGMRYAWRKVFVDGTVAWRGTGGDAQSDSRQLDPMFWLTVQYRF